MTTIHEAASIPPETPHVEICHGPRCCDYGGQELLRELKIRGVQARMSLCQSLCSYSPVVKTGSKAILNATAESVIETLEET